MVYKRLFLLVSIIFIVLSSCSILKDKRIDKPLYAPSSKFTMKNVFSQNHYGDFGARRIKIDFISNTKKFHSEGYLKCEWDSGILMSIQPLFSIEVMRAFMNRDSIHVLNRMEKSYMVRDFKYVENFLGFHIDYLLLQDILVGNFPDKSNFSFVSRDTEIVDDKIKLYTYIQNFNIDFFIDPFSYKIVSAQIVDKLKKQKLNIEYQYEENFPSTIEFNLNERDVKTYLKLIYQGVSKEKVDNLGININRSRYEKI
ncbi:MAG: DUF4292 domain-containing protein [Bacteroidota bacterium]